MSVRIRETALLLRIQLYRLGGINGLLHGRDKRQKRRALGTLSLCLLLVLMAAGCSLMLALGLAEIGGAAMIPQVFALAVSVLALMTVMLKGPEMLFGGSDVPSLRAMPVSAGSIVMSRLIALLATELVFALLIGIPAGIVYGLYADGAGGLRLVLALCLLTAMPMAAALALGTLLARLTIRMRHRAIVTAALNIVLFIAIMAASFSFSIAAQRGKLTQSLMLVIMGRFDRLLTGIYPPADWTAQVAGGNVRAFALLLGTAVAALALIAAAATAGFARIADALGMAAPAARGKAQVGSPRAPVFALYQKEVHRFLSSTIYLMNASVGWLICAMAAVAVCLIDVKPWLALLGMIPGMDRKWRGLVTLAVMMIAGMSSTTSCSVSMEGRQMETLRAMPVRKRDWLGAKLMLHMTLAAPSVVFCGAVLSVRLGFGLARGALLVFAPLLYSLLMGGVGLALNLRFPRLDWEREVEAVKNGVSVLLTLLIGMAVPLGIGAVWMML